MKKKVIYIFLLLFMVLGLSGCFDNDKINNTKITTTVYPIEFLVNRLYGTDSKIVSIYPNGTDVYNFKLTKKEINDYAKNSDIFVYNGLTDEKEIARNLINKNKKMQLVDVSYGLKYINGIEELWLSPDNYLMLANTIKNDLQTTNSTVIASKIEENYKVLEEDLSILDANLKSLGDSAKANGKEEIVIADDTFAFLNSYGFKTTSIADENNITNSIKNKFKDKTYKYIFVRSIEDVPDAIKDLVDNYQAELVEINTMNTLTDKERENHENYLTIMEEFITNLSNVVLS